jgi:hypothetical protein
MENLRKEAEAQQKELLQQASGPIKTTGMEKLNVENLRRRYDGPPEAHHGYSHGR